MTRPLAGLQADSGEGVARGTYPALRRGSGARPRHPIFAGGPLLIAHRGGAGLAPENTLAAFEQARTQWNADMIELDVRATADGHCVVIHDPSVDRTTNGSGAVAAMTLEELRALDAGFRFTPDDGRTYPYRGRGVRVPTIEEVFEALPHTRLTIEVKAAAAQRPLFEAIRRAGAADRVIAAGQYAADRTLFRDYPGPTSPASEEFRRFYVLHRLHLGIFWAPPGDAVQLPECWEGRRILTPRLIRDLHGHGLDVHVWTVNEVADMERLLDWGVDGLVTDRPDRLAPLLAARRTRPPDSTPNPPADPVE